MAQRIHEFAIVAGADNPPPNGLTLERTDFPPGIVTAIQVQIPAGHMHKTGIQVLYADAILIPANGNTFLTGNHVTRRFEFEDPHPGGEGWFVQWFNSDHFYDHTFHFTVELDELQAGLVAQPPVILLTNVAQPTADGAPAAPTPTPAPGGGVLVE